MTVIVAGSIAVFAYLFGDYMSRIINLGAYSSAIWAALVVGVLTVVNYLGIREGKTTQNLFTVLEVGGLVLIIVAGLVLAPAPLPAAAGSSRDRLAVVHRRRARHGDVVRALHLWRLERCGLHFGGSARPRAQYGARIALCHRPRDFALRAGQSRVPEGPRLQRDGALGRGRGRPAQSGLGGDWGEAHFDHDRYRGAHFGERLDDRRRALQLCARPRLAVARLSRPLGRGQRLAAHRDDRSRV